MALVAAWKQNSDFKFSLSSSLPFSSLRGAVWWWAGVGVGMERESLAHNGLSLFFNSSYFSGGSLVTKLYATLATPWTISCQAPLSMGFFRQEHWSGLPFPSPEDLRNPGTEPRSPALQVDSSPADFQGSPSSGKRHLQ